MKKSCLRPESFPRNLSFGDFEISYVLPLVGHDDRLFNAISFIRPTVAKTEELVGKGFTVAYATVWTTKFNQKSIEEVTNGWKIPINEDAEVHFEYLNAPRTALFTSKIDLWVDKGRGSHVTVSDVGRVIQGTLLLMVLYLREGNTSSNKPDAQTDNIINFLRIVAGHNIAIDRCLTTTFDLVSEKATVPASKRILMPEYAGIGFDGPTLSQHIQGSTIELHLTIMAETLYEAALESSEIWKRFLFLWLAFEAQTSSNGKEREKYILDVLGSERINDEALRLRNIRADIAHGRKATVSSEELRSIMGLFRLTCITSQPELGRAVKAYIFWLDRNHEQMS